MLGDQKLGWQLFLDRKSQLFLSALVIFQECVAPCEDDILKDFAVSLNLGTPFALRLTVLRTCVEHQTTHMVLLDLVALCKELIHRHVNRDTVSNGLGLKAHSLIDLL